MISLAGETLEIYRGIRAWLALYSGLAPEQLLPARHDEQPRPRGSFIAIGVRTRGARVEPVDERLLHPDGSLTIRGGRRATVQLEAYGEQAVAVLDELEYSRALPVVEQHLEQWGLAVEDITDSVSRTVVYEGTYEARAMRDVRLLYLYSRTVGPEVSGGAIAETFTASGELQDELPWYVGVPTGSFSLAFDGGAFS